MVGPAMLVDGKGQVLSRLLHTRAIVQSKRHGLAPRTFWHLALWFPGGGLGVPAADGGCDWYSFASAARSCASPDAGCTCRLERRVSDQHRPRESGGTCCTDAGVEGHDQQRLATAVDPRHANVQWGTS